MGATSDSRSVRRRYCFQLNELEQTKNIGKRLELLRVCEGSKSEQGGTRSSLHRMPTRIAALCAQGRWNSQETVGDQTRTTVSRLSAAPRCTGAEGRVRSEGSVEVRRRAAGMAISKEEVRTSHFARIAE